MPTIPGGEYFAQLLSSELTSRLPSGVETQEEAERVVAEALDAAWAGAQAGVARTLVAQHHINATQRKAAAERERADQERNERTTKEAKKAWRQLYGRQIAGQLEPFETYRVLSGAGIVVAVPQPVASLNFRDHAGISELPTTSGVGIGKVTSRLDAVAADGEEALAVLLAAIGREKAAEAEAEQAARAAAAKRAEVARERDTYGVELATADDD